MNLRQTTLLNVMYIKNFTCLQNPTYFSIIDLQLYQNYFSNLRPIKETSILK